MPSINTEEREREQDALPDDREHHKLRTRAIVEVLNYEKSHNFLRAALTKSFETNRSSTYSFLRTVPGADDTLSSADRAVIAIRSALQLHSWNTIAVMLIYGLDPSRVPGGGTGSLEPANYNANIGLEQLDFNDGVLKKVPVDRGNGANDSPAIVMSDSETIKLGNKLKYWAGKWGLLGRSAPEHVRPFQNLIDVTLGLTLRPLLNVREMQNYFSLTRLFPSQMVQGSTVRSANGVTTNFRLDHEVGSLLYAQNAFARDLFAVVGSAVEHQMNRVMCTSLSMTPPGRWGDTWA